MSVCGAVSLGFSTDYRIWGSAFLMAILTGLLAGSYPALMLSRFSPNMLLKSLKAQKSSDFSLRKGLVGIAERGDARQQTRAEQETEEFDYQKGRRSFRETIEELQRDGASLGLDAKKLQLELTQQFGKKEAQARLDQILAQADYYKNGGGTNGPPGQ